ncbi:unnamed protein product, partial [Thlaspi arvense]
AAKRTTTCGNIIVAAAAAADKKYCSTILSSRNLYEVTEFEIGYIQLTNVLVADGTLQEYLANMLSILQPDQLTTEISAASSAPQPSVSSNKPLPKKRGRPLKTRNVENIPRGVSTFYSKAFEVFGDRVYDRSNNDLQPPLSAR